MKTPRTKQIQALVLITTVSLMITFCVALAFKPQALVSSRIGDKVEYLSSLDSVYYESLIGAINELSAFSKADPKSKVYFGHEYKKLPESIKKLEPHSVHTKDGEVQILLDSYGDKKIWITKSTRGDTDYILLHYTDDDLLYQYSREKRELYPVNRTKELVEPGSPYNSSQSLRD